MIRKGPKGRLPEDSGQIAAESVATDDQEAAGGGVSGGKRHHWLWEA